jgi:hypothetical protein
MSHRRAAILLALLPAVAWMSACNAGAAADRGLDSLMVIEGAQYVAGATPSAEDGPAVANVDLKTSTIWPGDGDKSVGGSLGASATAAVLALSSDQGHWIVPAGAPDFSTPTLPTFRATAAFSPNLSLGAYTLEVRAVDGAGRFGPPWRTVVTAANGPPSLAGPPGSLVVALEWDAEADLDLHVIDPAGDEIYHGKETTLDTFSPGRTADGGSYGYLDADSNHNCVIDGRRRETVTWVGAPPSGTYAVKVDVASLCGQPSAHYTVRATLLGSVVGEASGLALDPDTWGPHDRGAGTLVSTFEVP